MKKILLMLVFMMSYIIVNASHMMGSDISYTCISPGKYKIILKVYRDCRGIPLNSPNITAFCDNVGAIAIPYTRTGIYDISPNCVGGTAPCNPSNTPSSEGIEEHVFEATIDFNKSPFNAFKNAGCCKVYFEVDQCCRNGAITTINAGLLYTEAMLDICNVAKTTNKCNSSPQLSNPPVAYLCCNQPFTFNNGVKENIDGDSLGYSLSNPLNAHGSNENYTGNFTPKIPMTPFCPPNPGKIDCKSLPNAKPPRGFYFDELTGDIVFTPTNCEEVGVIVIQINEYRKDSATKKYILIGITRRDMQLVVKTCEDNNPPQITNSTNKYSTCEGNKICFTINSKDEPYLPKQTRYDTVTMTWNFGIPGATFRIIDPTAREKQGEFCWQTKIGDARPNAYTFSVTVKDDNCPKPAQSVRGFNVSVKPKARAFRKYDLLDCGNMNFESFPIDTTENILSQYTYEWTIRDSTNSGLIYKKSFSKKDKIKFKRGGKYIITHLINYPRYNCPTIYQDTVIIPPVLDVELAFGKDTFVCAGDSLVLMPIIAYGIPKYKYTWESPLGTKNAKDTFERFAIKPTFSSSIVLTLVDKNKCVDSDTIKVKYQPLPVVDIGPDQRICTYESVTLDAQNDDTLRYFWQPNGDSTRTITTSIAGQYIAKVIDHLGCNVSDTMNLAVNDTVVAIAKPNREICINDTLKVTGKRRPLGYTRQITWTDLNTNIPVANDSAFKAVIKTPATRNYEMFLRVIQGGVACIHRDTFNLIVNALPKFTFTPFPPRCFVEGAINLTQKKTAMVTPVAGYQPAVPPDSVRYYQQFKKPSWVTGGPVGVNSFIYDYPKFVTNAQVPKAGLRDTICYDYRNYKGCYNKECKTIKLNPNPVVQFDDGLFCQKAGLINLNKLAVKPFVKVGSIETYRCIDVPSGSGVDPASIVNENTLYTPSRWEMDPGLEGENQKTGAYYVEYCFKDAVSGCQTCDTARVTVVRLPEIEFDPIPNQCINYPLLALDSFVREKNSLQRFPKGYWETVELGGSRDRTNNVVRNALDNAVKSTKYFDPATGAGQYLLKFSDTASGCIVTDSTGIVVNGLPKIVISADTLVCSNNPAIALISNYPLNDPNGKWSGPFVTGSNFDATQSPKTKKYEGFYRLKFMYTNPQTLCTDSSKLQLRIQTQPVVTITNPKPYQQCENKVFNLKATTQWANARTWTTSGDGIITNDKLANTDYTHGVQDVNNGNAILTLTTDAEGVCPQATDNITLIVEPYPVFTFVGDPLAQCEPAIVNFSSDVTRPAGSPNLRHNWWFGNGDSLIKSTNGAPQNIKYDTAARDGYTVRLMVSNQWGAQDTQVCNTTEIKLGYIKVWPQPKAAFSSDPGFFTTVAFPKFKFQNESKVKFGNLQYLWQFDENEIDDTSTQVNPIHTYIDDTLKYFVTLRANFRYIINNNNDPADSVRYCTDSTGQDRKIGPDVTVFVPTAFSPEGTGPAANNKFRAVVNGEKSFEIILFNRWGEILWQTTDKYEGWNGTYRKDDAQQDVYAWVIKVTAFDGKEYQYEGIVTLIR